MSKKSEEYGEKPMSKKIEAKEEMPEPKAEKAWHGFSSSPPKSKK